MRSPTHALRRLGLPGRLVVYIREGHLEREVADAYARYERMCAALDVFEAQSPEIATRLPWHEAREKWKASGRPRPEWYEVLALFDWGKAQPLYGRDAGLEWPRPPAQKKSHRDSCRDATKRYRERLEQRKRDEL